MTTDLRALWDFDRPAESELRFRTLAASSDEPLATLARTQVARALGLQERCDEGHAVLDARAREIQLALKAELERAGGHDPYVDEELDLLGPAS